MELMLSASPIVKSMQRIIAAYNQRFKSDEFQTQEQTSSSTTSSNTEHFAQPRTMTKIHHFRPKSGTLYLVRAQVRLAHSECFPGK